MSCITKGNIRCSKCCEVLHIHGPSWERVVRGKLNATDGDQMLSLFTRISKRRAKKLNPHMFNREMPKEQKDFLKTAAFFTCNALINGVCSVYKDRPNICRIYGNKGKTYNEYSPTCSEDINIIARST